VLNNSYVNDFDNYKKGRVIYNISNLDQGSHSFTLRAWDNFNNSAEETIRFEVVTGGKFILKNLFNYPNPFTGSTSITGEMNRPGEIIKVILNIYSLNGKVIRTIRLSTPSTGYVLPPVEWDGLDDGGGRVARGMYLYEVSVATEKGERSRASGKMIIM
jgi:hypothetical protein